MNLYIVRHGLAKYNLPDPSGIKLNPAFAEYEKIDLNLLTPQGELQADLTGRRLSRINFNIALVSPVIRAVQTAGGILKHQEYKVPIELVYDLAECGTENYKVMSPSEYSDIWDCVSVSDYNRNYMYDTFLPKETPDMTAERAILFAGYLKKRFTGSENVLIVSHGGFIHQYLLQAFLEIPKEQFGKYKLFSENCSIAKLGFPEDGTIHVAALDETGHLGDAVSREPFTVVP